MEVQPIYMHETDLTADAVAFCPFEGLQHLLACGCYQLEGEGASQRRVGRLILLDVTVGQPVKQLLCLDGPGILDCRWVCGNENGHQLLASASSDGGLHLYRLQSGGSTPAPVELVDDGLVHCNGAGWCMTLDCTGSGMHPPQVALGSTAGMVHVCQLAPEEIRTVRGWHAHQLECWAVAWATHPDQPLRLYTGADDAQLKTWDLRCDSEKVCLRADRTCH